MIMANSRIKDLSERTTLASGDYLATDNNSGTRKVDASKILTPISTAQSTADLVTDKVSGTGDAFSSTKGYSVGELAIGPTDNLIYRCKTAYSTGASWSSRKSYFEQVTLVDAVSDLNDALSSLKINKFGTRVDLNSYTSTQYPIPHDGFVCVELAATSYTNRYAILHVNGSDGSRGYELKSISNGTYTNSASCFVKEGMKVNLEKNDTAYAWYYPLE